MENSSVIRKLSLLLLTDTEETCIVNLVNIMHNIRYDFRYFNYFFRIWEIFNVPLTFGLYYYAYFFFFLLTKSTINPQSILLNFVQKHLQINIRCNCYGIQMQHCHKMGYCQNPNQTSIQLKSVSTADGFDAIMI